MKEVLSIFVKRLISSLVICTVVIATYLCYIGQAMLVGALFIGYLAAGVCIWTLVYRTWRSASLDVDKAKQQMLWGLILRLTTCFVVLATAAHLSLAIFAVATTGFLLCYVLAMFFLIQYKWQIDRQATKGR